MSPRPAVTSGRRPGVLLVLPSLAALMLTAMPHATADDPEQPPAIVDVAGDANGLWQLGERDTRPASDDRADILKIWPETAYDTVVDRAEDGTVTAVRHLPTGLRINVQTGAPARPATGPTLKFLLPVSAEGCEITFSFYVHGPLGVEDPPESATIEDTLFEGVAINPPACIGDDLRSPGFAIAFDGAVTRLEFPFDVVRGTPAKEAIFPGAILSGSSMPPAFQRVRQSPTGSLLLYGYVDRAAALPESFVIGSDVPADVQCAQTPDHPACAG